MINTQESVFKERARFFIIKSHSKENLELSMTHSIWATTKNPTNKFQQAFDSVENVILIFSTNDQNSIHGVARMESKMSKKIKPNVRLHPDPETLKNPYHQGHHQNMMLMSNFKVNWILKCQYPFK